MRYTSQRLTASAQVLSYRCYLLIMSNFPQDSLSAQNNGFIQNGTIDWVALLKTLLDSSIGIISRVSAAGVDTYTVIVAQAVGKQFKLTRPGRQRVVDAVSQLKGIQTINEKLWLGFGFDNFIRVITRTEEGTMCLAICAALSECFYDQVAAEIIMEMVRTSRAPGELQPSILEWKRLLQASAGVYAKTSFSEFAEDLMRRHPTQRGLELEHLSDDQRTRRGCSSPESIAEVLLSIAKISSGRLGSITVEGGADAGWLAAFAQWHFDLTVRIVCDSGTVLYESDGCLQNDANIQFLVIYTSERSGEGNSVQTVGTTHRLQDATILIMKESDRIDHYFGSAVVAGRIPWDRLLSSWFAPEFKKLQGLHHTVGGILGSLSRIAQAIATSEGGIDVGFSGRCRVYGDKSYGKGLVEGLTQWFPELGLARMPMEEAVRFNLAKAFSMYETFVDALKVACNCTVCQGRFSSQEEYCLLLLLEVLFIIARTMSSVQLPPNLYPSRLGLETLYKDQMLLHRDVPEDTTKHKILKDFGPAYFGLDGQGEGFSVLSNAATLLSTRPPSWSWEDEAMNALSSNGICFCWRALTMPHCALDSFGIVDVVPGRIELEGKSYSLLLDSADVSLGRSDGRPELIDLDSFSLLIREKALCLEATFEFADSEHKLLPRRLIGPADLVYSSLKSRGMVHCTGLECKPALTHAKVLEELPGYKLYQFGGQEIEVFQARWREQLLLLHCKSPRANFACFFIDRECLNCSLHAAAIANQRYGPHTENRGILIRGRERDSLMDS